MLRNDIGAGLHHRLAGLGFPFGGGTLARAKWAEDNVKAGRIARISQTEQMMGGVPVERIAHNTGLSVGRVYYQISRPPSDFGDPEEGWHVQMDGIDENSDG